MNHDFKAIIFKYKVNLYDETIIDIKNFATSFKILKLAIQNDELFVWIQLSYPDEYETMKPDQKIIVTPVPTGKETDYLYNYFDTIFHDNGLVIHYYIKRG